MQVSRWAPGESDDLSTWARLRPWALALGVLVALDRGLAGVANLIRVARAVRTACLHREAPARGRARASARPETRARSSSPVPGFAVPLCSHGREGTGHPTSARSFQAAEVCDS